MRTAIFWFRRDLRLRDNHGLFKAMQSDLSVVPIFIFDTEILEKLENKSDPRVTFLLDTVQALGIKLYHGSSLQVIKDVVREFSPWAIFVNEDYEPQAIVRDEKVKAWLATRDVQFFSFKDQVIFAKGDVVKDDGAPYTVFTPYSRKWLKTLASIPHFPSERHLDRLQKNGNSSKLTLKQLGFVPGPELIPPRIMRKSIVENYAKNRNFPALKSTTQLGLHLRFGTLSVREAVRLAKKLSPVWLSELIWREFFMMILHFFPHTVSEPFRPAYKKIQWRNDENEFRAWCEGKTGYPFVDAGMRELNATGFMHNRVRMVTASFLIKHLLIDWRWGERYFAKKLLDFDLSANVGNWQWAAGCGCDAAPYFRVFNPLLQQKKFDAKNEYVKKWVPEYLSESYCKPIVDHEFARRRVLVAYAGVKK